MLFRVAHLLLMGAYLALPVGAVLLALVRWTRGRPGALARLAITLGTGLGLGVGMCWAYGIQTGKAGIWQVALAAYFAAGMLLLLRILDWTLRRGLRWILRVKVDGRGRTLDPGSNRTQLAMVLRLTLLAGIALPYVLVALMTYRPAVPPTPAAALPFALPPHERVTFSSADGVGLVGWWIAAQAPQALQTSPASQTSPTARSGEVAATDNANKTILLCHGLDADKAQPLLPAMWLMLRGYNVLTFDFRAHGESGGRLVSFGGREGRDVLGAVKWLKANHPEQSRHIYGLGINTGAAALIAAAADPSAEGQAIDALAVYGPYDRFGSAADVTARELLAPPVRWLVMHIGLPLASAQVGTNLADFAPVRLVNAIWPRPILVIFGEHDPLIDFQGSWRIFEAASQPKEQLWLEKGLNEYLINLRAATTVEEFFAKAHSLPAI